MKMSRIVLGLIVVLLLIGGSVEFVTAANPTINITVKASYLSVSVDPTGFSFGIVWVESTYNTTTTYFNVTNSSNCETDQTIGVVNSAWNGGVSWTHNDTCTIGPDTVGLKANRGGTWGVSDIVVKYSSPNYIYENCVAGTGYLFGLKFYAATSFSDGNTKENIVRISTALS